MVSLYSTKSKFIEVLLNNGSSWKICSAILNGNLIMIGKNEIDIQY